MIEQSFVHIKGIGNKTECKLWEAGIYDWSSFNKSKNIPLSKNKIEFVKREINISEKELKANNPNYFSKSFKPDQHWRIFKNFKSTIAYLDIETTGLYPSYSNITTISLYDGKKIKYYINGKNLNDFKKDIIQYKLIVTYNGKCFDIPFIENILNIRLRQAHIDLRYLLKSLGYSGGLKECEKQLGISRGDLEGVDGKFAIYLWLEFIDNNDSKSLDTLLAYNIEDVVNLEYLMHKAYNIKLSETPFRKQLEMNIPLRPKIPFKPDRETIRKIKDKYYRYSNPYSF